MQLVTANTFKTDSIFQKGLRLGKPETQNPNLKLKGKQAELSQKTRAVFLWRGANGVKCRWSPATAFR